MGQWCLAYPAEHLLAVVLLPSIKGVIEEGEPGRAAATKLSLETEDGNVLLLSLEGLRELGLDVTLRDVGLLGVDQLNDLEILRFQGVYALSPLQERVLHELASVQNKLLVCHLNK